MVVIARVISTPCRTKVSALYFLVDTKVLLTLTMLINR